MSTFPKMSEIVQPAVLGCAAIEHYEVTKLDADMASMRGMYTEPGKVAILKVHGRTFMSDTYHERRSNNQFAWRAKGDVLVAGLGLGMILHPVLDKPEVTSVTVIEKYPEVVELITPTLPHREKLVLITADIFNWQAPKGMKWDTIYFDIWADMCGDNLEEIAKLHQRFKGRKKPGGWMDSWAKDEIKDNVRRRGW